MVARRKQKPAEKAKPDTLADVLAALQIARDSRKDAEQKLAADGRHPSAVAQLHKALADLRELGELKASLERVEAMRAESRHSKAQKAAQAEACKTAEQIVKRVVNEQREAFEEKILPTLALLAEGIAELEASQRRNAAEIRGLGGDPRKQQLAINAASNVGTSVLLRDALQTLNGQRLLEPWLSVEVPPQPSRLGDETHQEFAARQARTRTPATVFADCAERLQCQLANLLGPAPKSSEPVTPWHGSTRAHPGMSSADANVSMGFDDRAQKKRTAQRVKDSATPVNRDQAGKIVRADQSPQTFSELNKLEGKKTSADANKSARCGQRNHAGE